MNSTVLWCLMTILLCTTVCLVKSTPIVPCPEVFATCVCRIPAVGLRNIDCSRKGLDRIPDNLDGLEISILHLDLSYNTIKIYPDVLANLTVLESLDLSNNEITSIPETASLPPNLHQLYLANNNFTNWIDLNPTKLFASAANLHTLSLSGNSLHSLTSNDERLLLISPSLKILDLSHCDISKVSGRLTLSGLLNLEHLLINGNPLHTFPQLNGEKLLSIDLNTCKITHLHPDVFDSMPILTYVNLSRNTRLSLERNENEFVKSISLRRIDLSYCNMDAVELNGFPNLTTILLKGNLINQLTWETFDKNELLENIDLSYNSIAQITSGTFRKMINLRNIDLSFNMIRKIEPETFRNNDRLSSINLSRNYIDRFRRIAAVSLTYLNVSWCEILNIDLDAFNDMPELIELDISNNIVRDFPNSLHSATLQILDLSNCRLFNINNDTFRGFPELSRLNLAGNRFTTTFRTEYFAGNPYLNDIWLGDNPWRCECFGYGLQEFYQYLTVPPARTNDRSYLRCASPDEHLAKHWNVACHTEWYPERRRMGMAEKIWTITMLALMIGSINFCIFLSFKKWLRSRAEQRREQERMQVIDDARELIRHNRRVLEQEAQLNAPDPRETHPPCYEDAIHMPRLDSSFASLKHLEGDSDSDDRRKAAKRSRCRSEELISCRNDTDDGVSRPKRHILAARIRRFGPNKTTEVAEIPARSPTSTTSPHRCSTEIITLKCSPRMSRAIANDLPSHTSSTSEFVIEPMERYINFAGRSPYAQRKMLNSPDINQPSSSTQHNASSLIDIDGAGNDIVVIENHYASIRSLFDDKDSIDKQSLSSSSWTTDSELPVKTDDKRRSVISSSSDEYTSFTKDEIQNVKRSQF